MDNQTFPLGFRAKRDDGDEVEWRYDPKAGGYRFSKWWDDPHTRKREVLANGMFCNQQAFNLQKQAQSFRDAGWTVELLESKAQQIVALLLDGN